MPDIRLTPASANPNPIVRESVRAIIWDGSRVVLNREGNHDGIDTWELPGGGIDPGESSEDAVLREAREETGLVCRVVRKVGIARSGGPGSPHGVDEYRHHTFLLQPVSGKLGVGTAHSAEEQSRGCISTWLTLAEAERRAAETREKWWQAHTLWGLDWLREEIRAGRA